MEASAARDRIKELKQIEEEKMKLEASQVYENQRQTLEKEQEEELMLINKKLDEELKLLMDNFQEQESELLAKHEKELKEFKEDYEKKLNEQEQEQDPNESVRNKTLKPSSEMLNLMKIKENAIKQKQYEKAHEASVKLEELAEKEIEKYNKEKQKKYKLELNKVLKRQEAEKNGFELKKESVLVTFNKTKNANLESLSRKYKSRLNELENWQKVEYSNFNKIQKGLSRPNSRIHSILKSASSFKGISNNNHDN